MQRMYLSVFALLLLGAAPVVLMVSGSQAVSKASFAREGSTDRSGNDMKVVTLAADQDAAACEALCAATQGCVAYTYVKQSKTVPQPVCRIKDAKPFGHQSSCCTSGAAK